VLQLLAAVKRWLYQGITFLTPFFFLLVDSVLESALAAFTGAAAGAAALACAGWDWPVWACPGAGAG